jgi:hypothetical protein
LELEWVRWLERAMEEATAAGRGAVLALGSGPEKARQTARVSVQLREWEWVRWLALESAESRAPKRALGWATKTGEGLEAERAVVWAGAWGLERVLGMGAAIGSAGESAAQLAGKMARQRSRRKCALLPGSSSSPHRPRIRWLPSPDHTCLEGNRCNSPHRCSLGTCQHCSRYKTLTQARHTCQSCTALSAQSSQAWRRRTQRRSLRTQPPRSRSGSGPPRRQRKPWRPLRCRSPPRRPPGSRPQTPSRWRSARRGTRCRPRPRPERTCRPRIPPTRRRGPWRCSTRPRHKARRRGCPWRPGKYPPRRSSTPRQLRRCTGRRCTVTGTRGHSQGSSCQPGS